MNPKTKKIVIIGSAIGGIGLIVAIIIFGSKRKKIQAAIAAGNSDILVASAASMLQVSFPLQRGSGTNPADNTAVKLVQRYINEKNSKISFLSSLTPLTEDGIFGSATENALNNLASVTVVSEPFYNSMQAYLTPSLLSAGANVLDALTSLSDSSPYSNYLGINTNPAAQKNNLILTRYERKI
jgi:hypothetical protein